MIISFNCIFPPLVSSILLTPSKMAKPVIYYFPVKAMGESARLLLAYGGEDFVDHRVTFDDWPALKPSTPFGQVPVLEINGKKYGQSLSIARYLGRKYGLVGGSIEEDLEIDQNVDFVNDIRSEASEVHYERHAELKEEKHEQNVKNVYPGLLKKLDEVIKANNGHIALGKLTWADFVFAGIFDYVKVMLRMPDLEKTYPSFQQVIDAVYAIPQVQKYRENAPKSDVNY